MNSVSIDALRQEVWAKDLLDDVQRDVENVMQFMGKGRITSLTSPVT